MLFLSAQAACLLSWGSVCRSLFLRKMSKGQGVYLNNKIQTQLFKHTTSFSDCSEEVCVASVHLPWGSLRHVHLEHCLPHPTVPWNLVIQAAPRESPHTRGDVQVVLRASHCAAALGWRAQLSSTRMVRK